MKLFNFIFIVLFIIAAILQYNDPDPFIWVSIYLYATYLCYKAFQKIYYPVLYGIGLAAYTVYAIILFFDKTGVLNWRSEHHAESIVQTMQATKPWIEETREFFGLLILIIVLLINMIWFKRKMK